MQHARLPLLQVVVFQHSFGYLGRVDAYEFDARLLPLVTVAGGVIVWWRSGSLWAVTFLLLYPALGLAVERVCDALFRWAVQDNLGWSLGVRNLVAAVRCAYPLRRAPPAARDHRASASGAPYEVVGLSRSVSPFTGTCPPLLKETLGIELQCNQIDPLTSARLGTGSVWLRARYGGDGESGVHNGGTEPTGDERRRGCG
jgi:hypothetical protein